MSINSTGDVDILLRVLSPFGLLSSSVFLPDAGPLGSSATQGNVHHCSEMWLQQTHETRNLVWTDRIRRGELQTPLHRARDWSSWPLHQALAVELNCG